MEIYLMQHGECLSKEQDPEQPLSEAGMQQVRTSALAMQALGLRPALLLSSPKRRSRQTAQLIAEPLGLEAAAIIETELVKAMTPAEETLGFLARFRDRPSLLIAGHLPSLRELASLLLTGGSHALINFKNGGLCCISAETLPSFTAQLEYCLTPPQLALIARGGQFD